MHNPLLIAVAIASYALAFMWVTKCGPFTEGRK